MAIEESYSTMFVLSGVVAFLILVAFYIYFGFAWMTIAKRLKNKRPWLAFIPLANIALVLEMGGFHWMWTLLIAGALIANVIVGKVLLVALIILFIISNWRIFKKLNYPGWLSLVVLVDFIYAGLGLIAYGIVIGIVTWKERY